MSRPAGATHAAKGAVEGRAPAKRAADGRAAMGNTPAKDQARTRKAPAADRSTLFIGSTEKTFRVLHAFDGARRTMTLAEIARGAQLDRSAAQRIVHTLESLGYLARIPDGKAYGLTCKALQAGYNYVRAHPLIDKASPFLLEISRAVGETCNLLELDGADIVFIARFPGRHLVNINIAVGSRLPAYFTASGTAILSRLPKQRQLEVLDHTRLEPMTPHTECDPAKLLKRVARARETGYSVVSNETVVGDISVAAAITDHDGNAVGAINIAVPTTRWTVARAEAELVHHVQVAAASISRSRPRGS
jgi:IclR family transcriptional regulator, pca regulon regulatory protein